MRLEHRKKLPLLISRAASIAAALSVGGCGTFGYVPPEAINPPTRAFAKSTNEFVAGIRKDEIAPYRREVRRDEFVKLLVAVVKKPASAQTTLKDEAPAVREFLCEPRYGYDRISHRVAYISAVGITLADRAQDPADSLGELMTALSTSYTISVTNDAPPDTYGLWIADPKSGQRCANVVKDADPLVVRDSVGKEFSLLGAKAALDTIWSVIEPLVQGILANVDKERRAKAIRDYFTKDANVEELKTQLKATEAFLEKEFTLRQKRTAGAATVAAGVLFDPRADHWRKIVQIANSAQCRADVPKLETNKSDPGAIACVNQAMSAAAAPLEVALDTADTFDAAVEMQLPDNRLSAQIETLRDIALGKQPPEAQVKALWAAITRYFALFQTARDTVSDENRKKIKDALKALEDALSK